jgi:hypothetical protein
VFVKTKIQFTYLFSDMCVVEGTGPVIIEPLADITIQATETKALGCKINRGKPLADIKW